MRHKKWISAIHLHREGELSDMERQALKKHLAKCKSCHSEYHQIVTKWKNIIEELAEDPILGNADVLTESVMSGIYGEMEPPSSKQVFPAFAWLNTVFTPSARIVLQFSSIILLGIFFYEQVRVVDSIKLLEEKLDTDVVQTIHARPSIIPQKIRTRLIKEIRDQIKDRTGKSDSFNILLQIIRNKALYLELQSQNKKFPGLLQQALSILNSTDSIEEGRQKTRRKK